MEISIKSFKLKIEFSFVLILCAAVMLGADNALRFLLFSALHELGHIVAFYLLGAKIERLTLSCCGAALRYKSCLSPHSEAIAALAGPAVNLALYAVFNDEVNLLLFSLNMLPVFPLDGGRAVKAVLPHSQPVLGLVVLVLLTVCGVYAAIKFKIFGLLAVSVYLWSVNLRLL